ncbi:unnamed protein product [Rhizophagus irregularis]|uniref:SAM domain-containing protein n=1 Tax=Rhizophagus irregularis TaxID=588596 RepID=A0A915ZDA9_9GLOM|nr:unnamed protein product [Rhizophagus irregularis]CAB5199162.1 unnamed protein product [Rhizophagus irregularis]CAB5372400.1 unnamed protein product [Rhizophagus irregularis]
MVKLSAEGIKSLRDMDSLVQCLKEAGLNKRALDFLQEQHISGEDFLELTYNELDSRGLELGPMKSILRTIDKINKTEQVNNDIDESLIQSFEEFSVKEIAAETHKGYLESTLKQLCEKNILKKNDRLYYRRRFGPQANNKIVSCLCRIEKADNDGLSVVMHIKDEKRLGQKLSSMTDLENKILDEIYEVDKNKSVPKDQWPKVFDEPFDHFGFLRPMTLSSFKKNHG